jgi:hypothetical protein
MRPGSFLAGGVFTAVLAGCGSSSMPSISSPRLASKPTASAPTTQPTSLAAPSASPAPTQFGTIEGMVASGAGEGSPLERVAAFPVDHLQQPITVDVYPGPYTLRVPAGVYHVLVYVLSTSCASPAAATNTNGSCVVTAPASPSDFPGGYDQAVICGGGADVTYGCSDTTLVDVTVRAGQTVGPIDPADWYWGNTGNNFRPPSAWPTVPTASS